VKTPIDAVMTRHADSDEEVETLRARLAEANETLRAIRQGEVDALIVQVGGGDQVYTLHTADEPYRDLVEQMQEGAVVLAVSGDILYCNARFAALVGEPLESVIGTRIDRFVHPSDRGGFQALLSSRNGRRRSQLIGSDAGTVEVYLSLTTTVSNDVDRLNLIVTDLRELHEAYSNLDRAERESRMKDEFLAMLAHELRNPLGAINSAVQVLELTHSGGESGTRARTVIARQVGHLSHLIDDLLDVERVVSGKIQLNRRPLDMAEAVRRAVGSVIGDAGLNRHVDISTVPVWVDGDAVRLEQVLTNLVTNAVKYTPAGSQIRVELRGDGSNAELTVEDTGVGISPDLLPFIFDMFVQGDRTLDRARGGLGIGLTLVRRLVELHGGTVAASSDGEGHGSRFTVRLRQIPAAESSPGISSPLERAEPKRVLLIEDSRDAREMFRMMLELAGHVVYDAADGVLGLELLEAEHPNVAIIDIGLPGLDGYQVARRIREHPNGRAMLLLAVTGYGFPSDCQHSAEAGFDHHLVKPVDPDELERLLSESTGRVVETHA
jgi:PAS domain S-box-containing protein